MKTFLLAVALLLIPPVFAERIQPTEATKGCIMKGCSLEGNCVRQFFVKVADADDNPDTDESQIWGFDPQNKHKDRDGNIIFVRELEKDFLRAGQSGRPQHGACVCHCPNW